MEVEPVKIELTIGYTDKQTPPVTHTRVTIGKLITGKELFAIDEDPQSRIPTQYQLLLLRAQITEFGTLKMPVPLSVLLALDSIDSDDLTEAVNKLGEAARGDRKAEPIGGNKVKLAFGYTRNGLTYDVVEFGRRLTGMDSVEADKLGLTDTSRTCFDVGRQITKLSQSGGTSVLEGPFEADLIREIFEGLYAVDIFALRLASEAWRQSFRRAGAIVSQNGTQPDGAAAGGGDGLERTAHPVAAG